MPEIKKCAKCGCVVSVNNRFCEKCGNPLHILLDNPKIQEEKFFDVFCSIFYLLRDKNNKERQKYFSPLSESILFQRAKRFYKDFTVNAVRVNISLGIKDAFNFDSNPFFQNSTTNALSGYSLRTAEELYSGRKSNSLHTVDIESMIQEYMLEEKKEFGDKSLYANVDLCDPLVKREIFSSCLGGTGVLEKYNLLSKEETMHWYNVIGQQNIKMTIETEGRSPERIEDEVVSDLLFGYCLRLSESLMHY